MSVSGRLAAYGPILAVAAALSAVPLLTGSNTILNAMVTALLIGLAGQGWNILGGYGGQFSFGHAAFFGTGAYATAILQARYGSPSASCRSARACAAPISRW